MQLARRIVQDTDATTLGEQLELVAIPAPPFGEAARGREMEDRLAQCGLAQVRADREGNRLGMLPAPGQPNAAPVVLAAHLDTVFPDDTPIRVARSGNRIYAPGITDNTRGLAALLAVARALVSARVRTRAPLVFAATVGEEGAGDLRGVKHLFADGGPLRGAASFVALDGSGLRRVVHRAVGARRFRVAIAGPGGHSWADRGTPNPVHALGRLVAALAERTGGASVSVGRICGGTSVNAIPENAWLEIDARAEEAATLAGVEAWLGDALARAVGAENAAARPGAPILRAQISLLGDRPAGATPEDSPLVQTAISATRALGTRPELASASTDANVPMALGIPAVTLGAGGEGGGVHTRGEWYSNRGGARGVERALLVALAAAGLADS